MHKPEINEFNIKKSRIYNFLDDYGYDAILIGTTANFAWATCGGDNHILHDSQAGSCLLVFAKENMYCIANRMDARRIEEQEIAGLGLDVVSLKWFEPSITEYALDMLKGKKVLSDIPLQGTDYNFQMFYKLHYPLTEMEIERYGRIGKDTEDAVVSVAGQIKRGQTGMEIANSVFSEFAERKLLVSCMIVGLDDEIKRYRHPLPSDIELDKALMLVLAGKRYGLNVPITRMIYFGDVPKDIQKRYQAACTIEASTMLSCVPGAKFHDISMMQKDLYKQFGYEKEWEEHFVGGLTGYMANDASFCVDREAKLVDKQTFNWYVTITGVNVEETMITINGGQKLFTVTGKWPAKKYSMNDNEIELPQIMVKN